MKTIWRFIGLGLIVGLSYSTVDGQNCEGYHKKCVRPDDKRFVESSLSRDFSLREKQRYSYNLTLFEGREYYISVYGHSKLGNLQYRILSVDDNKLLYDNSAYGFQPYFQIKSQLTQRVKVEVSAPLGKVTKNQKECVGMYILYRKN